MSGCKLFLGGWFVCLRHGGVPWIGKLWTVFVLCWKCRTRLLVMQISRASAVLDFVQNVTCEGSLCSKSTESTDFCKLLWTVLQSCLGSNQFRKTFWGKFMIDWTMDILNCKFIITFQPDGCAESTFTATCFYSFCYKPLSRQLPVSVIPKTYARGVFICLLIHCVDKLVWNILVNQKRFLYMTFSKDTPKVGRDCRIHRLFLCRGIRPHPYQRVSWIWH